MKWSNVRLILLREIRDQLRDRRTLFTIAILPILLYPLLGMTFFQVAQFLREHPARILLIGASELPETPPLFETDADGQTRFAESLYGKPDEARLLLVDVEESGDPPPGGRAAMPDPVSRAKEAIASGMYDAVIYFPANFDEELQKFRAAVIHARRNGGNGPPGGGQVLNGPDGPVAAFDIPAAQILFNPAKDKSGVARDRLERVLDEWRETIVRRTLVESRLPAQAARPFQVVQRDLAEGRSRQALVWSKILPFVVLIWALTGAFYPAIDLCAGEKERGTLETLLSSPAERSEIVWGKLLTVMFFSVATSLLNLASMGLTGTFIILRLQANLGPGMGELAIGPPPPAAFAWLVVALVPISALFSALSLAVASLARSSKEGQYYLMPLLLISMPLMMIPMLPAAELDLGNSLIPVTGAMLLLRMLIEGEYWQALIYAPPVIAVTGVCCLLAIRWAIDQFNNESVLFRESERLDLRLWFIRLLRDRGETPTVGEAVLCGVLLLLIRFFAGLMLPEVERSFAAFAVLTIVTQFALIATPVLLMTIMLTRSPRKTLLLGMPPAAAIPAAVLLAVALHPAVMFFAEVVKTLYPMNPDVVRQFENALRPLEQAPNIGWVLVLIALLPAICEELAFRGFILSGLRHSGHKWGAIAIASVFFGILHGMFQQSLVACAMGMVLGYLAVQTGSLLPAVLFHFTNNAMSVLVGSVRPEHFDRHPMLGWLLVPHGEGYAYQWPLAVAAGVAAVGLLWWFRGLRYRRTEEEKLQEALDHQSAGAAAP
jgi:sodium transport system permease protein